MAKRGRKPAQPTSHNNNKQAVQPVLENQGRKDVANELEQPIKTDILTQQEQESGTVPQELLFVYGSLMKNGRFHGPISELEMVGNQAYLPFTRKTMQKDGSFPTPIPDVTSLTVGEAYLLPTKADEYAKMMANLDRIEAVSIGLYARTQLPIIVRENHEDNRIGLDFMIAWVYVAQETVAEPEQVYDFAPLFAKFKEQK